MSFQKVGRDDSGTMEGTECVLLYGFEGHEKETLQRFLTLMGVRNQKVIAPNNTYSLVRDIVEDNMIEEEVETINPDKAMIFHAMSGKKLNMVLENMKKTGLKRPLVAVVTETSKNWTFSALLEELAREREAFAAKRGEVHTNTNEEK